MAIETKPQTDEETGIPGSWIEGEFFPYFLSPEETQAEFDTLTQKHFGVSGEEFIRRLGAGEYDDMYNDPDHPHVVSLALFADVIR